MVKTGTCPFRGKRKGDSERPRKIDFETRKASSRARETGRGLAWLRERSIVGGLQAGGEKDQCKKEREGEGLAWREKK